MDYIDIYKSYTADYYKQIGITYKRTRRRQIVLSMAAMMNAMQHKMGPTDIGRIFNVNHSTVLYHHKQHESKMIYQDYRSLFQVAVEKINEAAITIGNAKNAIHVLSGESEESIRVVDIIDNESWIAIHCCIEKLIEDYGISIKTTPALEQEVGIAAKNLCTMLLRHVQLVG